MTTDYKYKPIEHSKNRDFLIFTGDFKPEKSNKIIIDLVEKIEQYEQTREMKVKYYKENAQGIERIKKVKMKSKDGVIGGVIGYVPPHTFGCGIATLISYGGSIQAKFNFNSNNSEDKTEYQGLVKILKNM